MGASLGSHDTGDDYQLGYMITHMRGLRIESMQLRNPIMHRDIRFFDSIVNPVCLPSMSPSLSASRIRSNEGRFGPAYSVGNRNRGWGVSWVTARRTSGVTIP